MFRPINSSESNVYTIRTCVGYGSALGNFSFNDTAETKTIVSASGTPSEDYLASPSKNNLPSGFTITILHSETISATDNVFTITYGKSFTSQPSVSAIPHFVGTAYTVIPIINKTSLTACNLSFVISNTASGQVERPSVNGTSGLLGFDLVITGPVKVGVNTGNSNKGWALNDSSAADPSGTYSSLDITLGDTYNVDNSIVVASKNLKYLGTNQTLKTYTASGAIAAADYYNTVWLGDTASGVHTLTGLTSTIGMVLIIINTGATNSLIFNSFGSSLSINTGGTSYSTSMTIPPKCSVTLFGTSSSAFYVTASSGTIAYS